MESIHRAKRYHKKTTKKIEIQSIGDKNEVKDLSIISLDKKKICNKICSKLTEWNIVIATEHFRIELLKKLF